MPSLENFYDLYQLLWEPLLFIDNYDLAARSIDTKEAKRKEAQRYMFTNDFIGRASHVIHGAANVSKTLKQAKAN